MRRGQLVLPPPAQYLSSQKPLIQTIDSLDEGLCAAMLLTIGNKTTKLVELLRNENVLEKTKLFICTHLIEMQTHGMDMEDNAYISVVDCLCQIATKKREKGGGVGTNNKKEEQAEVNSSMKNGPPNTQ